MRKLKKVGFYKELKHGDSDGPSLEEAAGKLCLEKLEKILLYLQSAQLLIGSPGLVNDVLNNKHVIGPLNIMTDGEWAWPSDLNYYLEKYRVSLPADFIEHMVNANWEIAQFNIDEVEL